MEWTAETSEKGVTERGFRLPCEGRQVPGIVWTQEGGSAPTPIVLIGHGGSGHKRQPHLLSLARRLVRHHGVAAAAIDGPLHGDRRPADLDEGDVEARRRRFARRRAVDEMIADWQATLDALQKLPELGVAPVGYWGLSMGTMFGVPLVAAEPRIAVAVLGLMGIREDSGPLGERFERDAPQVRCPVLFLQQWDDQLFPVESSNRLFGLLASEDKRLHAHPGQHAAVPPEEFINSETFLARHLLETR